MAAGTLPENRSQLTEADYTENSVCTRNSVYLVSAALDSHLFYNPSLQRDSHQSFLPPHAVVPLQIFLVFKPVLQNSNKR